ncbi:MAG: tyrosine-type recombinase/integrase [Thermoleophilaceae bacterium]
MAKGSIYPYELADGTTRYMAVYRTSNGVQRKKKGFSGVREAERFLTQTMADVNAGRVIASRDTFAIYIDRWLAEHRPRIEEGTYRDYRGHVERRLKPFFGEMRLADITPAHVRRYVAQLVEGAASGASFGAEGLEAPQGAAEQLGSFTVQEFSRALALAPSAGRHLERLERAGLIARQGQRRGVARRGRPEQLYRALGGRARSAPAVAPRLLGAKTVNNSLIPLRVALGHAVEDGLIARNPAASAPGARRRIKVPAAQPEIFLRLSEIPLYLEACSARFRPLAEVLIACGLRISEALELVWADVDLERATLLVTASRKAGRGRREVRGSTKGDRFRGVEFGPRIERVVRNLQARQSEHGMADPAGRPVFASEDGGRLDGRDLSRGAHKEALRDAGLRESLRLHDLRHTAAASWLAAGLPLIYVQRQLGHASITTTERQYGHLEKSFLRGAALRAEAAIWEGRFGAPEELVARR